jgi:hypothetical protein
MDSIFRLRRFLDTPALAQRKAPCELCGAPIDMDHAHVVDTDRRRLMCACRACYLLFTHSGAADGKFQSASERVLKLPDAGLYSGGWDALEVPVGLAFFVRNSRDNRVTAFYPSPAGVTEAGLPLEIWDEVAAANPPLPTLSPDTEALLICRRRSGDEAWIVPVDACYELAGRVRRRWKGFDGGEAWQEIDAFLAELQAREEAFA